jgi:tight adherence protein B
MLISLLAFGGVAGLIFAVAFLFHSPSSDAVEQRLAVLAGKKPADAAPGLTREALLNEGLTGLAGVMSRLFERFANLRLLFVQADLPMKPESFVMITFGAAGLGVGVGIVAGVMTALYPVFALGCSSLPMMWLLWRRSRRFKKFGSQMPGAMELIARALRSGHSLASGLHVVVSEMPAPISKEFGIAYEEQNLGVSIEQALKNLYKRMPNLDFKFFATAVAIQRQSGGDLAEILDKISHIIRERFRIMGQVQALTGEGRISGIVLMVLPIALFFAVWHLNPDYVMLLFTDELGRKMVAGAIVLQVLGAITIKKIIEIKV